MKIKNIILSFLALSLILSSCEEDFLETSPTDALSSDVLFDSFDGAQLALNGMYRLLYSFDDTFYGSALLRHHGCGYHGNVLDIDLTGEDMAMWDRGYGWYTGTYGWLAQRAADGAVNTGRWFFFYNLINQANIILLYAGEIEDATAKQIEHVKAQALVIRALGYYWVVQKHAHPYRLGRDNDGVPLYLEPAQEGKPRASVGEVFDQIIADLDLAIEFFKGQDNPGFQRHRSHANLPVAYGVAARTALAMNDYEAAADYADLAINSAKDAGRSLFTVGDFSAESHHLFNTLTEDEWMWGLQISEEHSLIYASFMSHMDGRFMSYASLGGHKLINHVLYDAMSPTDVRRNLWVSLEEHLNPPHGDYDSEHWMQYNNKKFLSNEVGSFTADLVMMRLAEMYLIKAEALAELGQYGVAQQALYDLMRNRDPEYSQTALTGEALVEEILFHRRIELWGEGFRNFDLQRKGHDLERTAEQGHNLGLANILNVPADDPRWLWLIPQAEIDANDAISSGDQNP